ncbi:SAM-dependent methyltransferase [Enterobacter cloacae]
MNTLYTDSYDRAFLLDNMMGPNAMRLTEELVAQLQITPGMRILDLGCGKGISSILLAEKYDATVFAADLWITPGENAARFSERGLDGKIFPLLVDATKAIPFAHDYFDLIVSVDAYQYFGNNDAMLGTWTRAPGPIST